MTCWKCAVSVQSLESVLFWRQDEARDGSSVRGVVVVSWSGYS